MTSSSFSIYRCLFLSAAVLALMSAARAEDKFPVRPIKIVVGSEAGSAPDAIARALASEMGPLLGQSVVVENRPGAAGTLGAAAVTSASADGYSVLMGTISNIALAPSFYPALKYDPNKSFTPIGLVASVPLVLVTSPAFQTPDLRQFTDKLKKTNPVSYSSPGVGGPQHLAGVLLQRQLGVTALHVPYKSGGAAVTAVIAGEVQFAFVGIPVAAPLVAGKRLVPVIVTSAKRSSVMPDVPSGAEADLRGFEIDNWHALLAPAGLPAPVRAALENALQGALKSPAVKEQFRKLGADPAPGTGKQLEAYIAAETERWSKFVTENRIKAE